MTNIYPELLAWQDEFTAIRRDLHAHPELSYEEFRTSDMVAAKLKEYGVDSIHRGLGGTGVVAMIMGKHPTSQDNHLHAMGLRADMDALPMTEETGLSYASTIHGKMHACGHDGHTTILLATAKYLAQSRNFAGRVYLVFQPAEEGGAGAKRMMDDGLFTQFPMDSVWALHNTPTERLGWMGLRAGPMMAASDEFHITVTGKSGHAARPHHAIDPIVAAAQLVQAVQTIISRNIGAIDQAVISICTIHGGAAHNVIPDTVTLGGTMRSFTPHVRQILQDRLHAVCQGVAAATQTRIDLDYRDGTYPATINTADETAFATLVAQEIFGEAHVNPHIDLIMGAEDFSFMLQQVKGCYIRLGSGRTDHDPGLHNTKFDFNDAAIPYGAMFFVRLVERKLAVV